MKLPYACKLLIQVKLKHRQVILSAKIFNKLWCTIYLYLYSFRRYLLISSQVAGLKLVFVSLAGTSINEYCPTFKTYRCLAFIVLGPSTWFGGSMTLWTCRLHLRRLIIAYLFLVVIMVNYGEYSLSPKVLVIFWGFTQITEMISLIWFIELWLKAFLKL